MYQIGCEPLIRAIVWWVKIEIPKYDKKKSVYISSYSPKVSRIVLFFFFDNRSSEREQRKLKDFLREYVDLEG